MMNPRSLSLAVCVLLAACAQQPTTSTPGETPSSARAAQPQAKVVAKPAPKPSLPAYELTEQLMLKLLLAEVAIQRAQPHVAVPAYLDIARETRDPRIAQRATEIAWNARFVDSAIEA